MKRGGESCWMFISIRAEIGGEGKENGIIGFLKVFICVKIFVCGGKTIHK